MLITSTDGASWTAPDTLTVRGVGYRVRFDRTGCDGPCLSLLSPDPGGPEYRGKLVRCACSYAEFAFGHPDLCTGPEGAGGPCANLLTVRVAYTCCELPGWGGPGWYCVRDAGSANPCAAVDLDHEHRCDATIEICSGPYADQAAAEAECPPPETYGTCCGEKPAAKKMRLVIDFLRDTASCAYCESVLNGVYDLELETLTTFCQWTATVPDPPGFSCGSGGTLRLRRVGPIQFTMEGSTTIYASYVQTYQTWDCNSPITLSRVDTFSPARCDGWPPTLTFFPV